MVKKSLGLLVVVAFALTACKSPQLEPDGVYGGDVTLYRADLLYRTSIETVSDILKWERDNRLALWDVSPDIKRSLDVVRRELPKVEEVFMDARVKYVYDPIDPNAASLEQALAIVRNLLNLANRAVELYNQ